MIVETVCDLTTVSIKGVSLKGRFCSKGGICVYIQGGRDLAASKQGASASDWTRYFDGLEYHRVVDIANQLSMADERMLHRS